MAHLNPLLHLLRDPRLEPHILRPYNGKVTDDPERPHDVRENPEHEHKAVKGAHSKVALPAVQHFEALAQGKVAHYVERVEIEPQRGVEGPSLAIRHVGVDTGEKLVGVISDPRLIVSQRLAAKAPVPDFPPRSVACGVPVCLNRAIRREDLIPGALEASGVQVDRVEGLWVGDGQGRRA